MSIHINVTCNYGHGACRTAIGVGFDSAAETFGDLVAGLRGIGWRFDSTGDSRTAYCYCPEHAPIVDWEDSSPEDRDAPEIHPECACVRPEPSLPRAT